MSSASSRPMRRANIACCIDLALWLLLRYASRLCLSMCVCVCMLRMLGTLVCTFVCESIADWDLRQWHVRTYATIVRLYDFVAYMYAAAYKSPSANASCIVPFNPFRVEGLFLLLFFLISLLARAKLQSHTLAYKDGYYWSYRSS